MFKIPSRVFEAMTTLERVLVSALIFLLLLLLHMLSYIDLKELIISGASLSLAILWLQLNLYIRDRNGLRERIIAAADHLKMSALMRHK
jgi:hypothetical protein